MKATLQKLLDGGSLTSEESARALDLMLEGSVEPESIGAFLALLRARKEKAAEIEGFAKTLLQRSTPLPSPGISTVDTCGTGGDGAGTFNISTTVAFVVAGAGLAVAKHGNRSVSSKSGSADVLEQLSVPVNLSPAVASRALKDSGFAFLFAPEYHPHLKKVASVRKNLGVRTVFNLLGPLVNPARVKRQIVGVFDADLLETMAQVLGSLGAEEVLVVRGEDGMDEISLCAPTRAVHWKDNRAQVYVLHPKDVGFSLAKASDLQGGDPAENARILIDILSGKETGARRDIVLLNAGAALWIGGKAGDWMAGVTMARQSLNSGAALRVLERARTFS